MLLIIKMIMKYISNLIIIFYNYMSVHPTKNLTPTTIIKLLLLGQSNVGKTSLATRYAEDRFNAQSNLLTVGIDIRKIDKEIKGKNVRL